LNKSKVGREKEEQACRYLEGQGVRIVERNFRCRQGEIDLIGYEREYLVFFEVKYRKDASMGSAAEAVNAPKRRKICGVADYYRMIHRYLSDRPVRFDVVAIDGSRMEWIRNAFEYCGARHF